MTVDVVIVNWNGGPELVSAVQSAQRFGGRAIVVDNASTSGAIDQVAALPAVTVEALAVNRGFAAACNAGARLGTGDVVFLLNPDAEIVNGNAADLEEVFRSTQATLLGVTLIDRSGRSLPTVYELPRASTLVADVFRLGRFRRSRRARPTRGRHGAAIVGAALAVRRPDWSRLGGLDDEFFLWYEDMDLGARAARDGGAVAVARSVVVRHRGATSWTRLTRRRRQWLRVRSAYRYARKHLGPMSALLVLIVTPGALAAGVLLDAANLVLRRR